MADETRVDRLIGRVKDTPVLAKVIFVGLVLIAVGEFTESVDKIWSFIEKRAVQASKTQDHPGGDTLGSSVSLPVDLNVLIFNAATDLQAHKRFEADFLRQYPGVQVDSSLDWAQRYEMDSSVILFQGQENENYARQLADWLPGPQEVQDYENNLGGFFGFSPDRDLIIFLGNDWPGIRRALRGGRPTPAVEHTDSALSRGPAAHR